MALTFDKIQMYSNQFHGATKFAISHTNWGTLSGALVSTATLPADKKHIQFGIGTGFQPAAVVRTVLLFPDPLVVGDDIKVI